MGQRHDEFIGIMAAAKAYGTSPDALRRRIDAGVLPVFTDPLDGRRRLLRRGDLERLTQPRPINAEQRAERSAGTSS